MAKQSTSYRLSPEAMRLTEDLGRKLGLSNTEVIETAVRRMAIVDLGAFEPSEIDLAAAKLSPLDLLDLVAGRQITIEEINPE
jgi:hypothetical protein